MTGETKLGARSIFAGIATNGLRIINGIVSPLDRLASVKNPALPTPLFVVGLPRSGTTLLYEMVVQAFHVGFFTRISNYTFGLPNLTTRAISIFRRTPRARYESDYGRIPGFCAPAENSHFWIQWFPDSPTLGHYVAADMLSQSAIDEANSVVGSLSDVSGNPLVFKNVYLSMSLGALLRTFPRARVLIVEREIEAVAASIYKKRVQLHKKTPWWSIRPPFVEDVSGRTLSEKVAFQCVRGAQIMNHEISNIGDDRCMVLSYAEICEAPGSVIKRIGDWLPAAFRPRANPAVPASFEQRPAEQIPPEAQTEIAQHSALFQADQDFYLRRVADATHNRPAA